LAAGMAASCLNQMSEAPMNLNLARCQSGATDLEFTDLSPEIVGNSFQRQDQDTPDKFHPLVRNQSKIVARNCSCSTAVETLRLKTLLAAQKG
jgi:hypothetical protein